MRKILTSIFIGFLLGALTIYSIESVMNRKRLAREEASRWLKDVIIKAMEGNSFCIEDAVIPLQKRGVIGMSRFHYYDITVNNDGIFTIEQEWKYEFNTNGKVSDEQVQSEIESALYNHFGFSPEVWVLWHSVEVEFEGPGTGEASFRCEWMFDRKFPLVLWSVVPLKDWPKRFGKSINYPSERKRQFDRAKGETGGQ